MPCKCQANKIVYTNFSETGDTYLSTINIDQSNNLFIRSKVSTVSVTQPDNILNLQYKVTPLEYCTYCVLKHLGLASVLLLTNKPYDKLLAVGQLMCVRSHLSKENLKLSDLFFNLAIYTLILLNKSSLLLILNIIDNYKDLSTLIMLSINISRYSDKLIRLIEPILDVCYAQALLNTELSYLNINKPYAVGALVKAASLLDNLSSTFFKLINTLLRSSWRYLQIKGSRIDSVRPRIKLISIKLYHYIGNIIKQITNRTEVENKDNVKPS